MDKNLAIENKFPRCLVVGWLGGWGKEGGGFMVADKLLRVLIAHKTLIKETVETVVILVIALIQPERKLI